MIDSCPYTYYLQGCLQALFWWLACCEVFRIVASTWNCIHIVVFFSRRWISSSFSTLDLSLPSYRRCPWTGASTCIEYFIALSPNVVHKKLQLKDTECAGPSRLMRSMSIFILLWVSERVSDRAVWMIYCCRSEHGRVFWRKPNRHVRRRVGCWGHRKRRWAGRT